VIDPVLYNSLSIIHGGKQENMEVEAARLIGAGLAMVGTIGAGIGIGLLVNGAVQGIARNPDASGDVQTNMILGIAFAEAVAIYCLVVALLILFVG
jgi:ATP synthase F0 subunit c